MSQTHDEIKQAFESYIAESEAFETKGVKAAAARARTTAHWSIATPARGAREQRRVRRGGRQGNLW